MLLAVKSRVLHVIRRGGSRVSKHASEEAPARKSCKQKESTDLNVFPKGEQKAEQRAFPI